MDAHEAFACRGSLVKLLLISLRIHAHRIASKYKRWLAVYPKIVFAGEQFETRTDTRLCEKKPW